MVAIETQAGRVAVGCFPRAAGLGFRGWTSGVVWSLHSCPVQAKRSLHVPHSPFSFSLFSPSRSFLPTSDQHRTVCPPLAPSLFSLSPHTPLLPQPYRLHLLIPTGTTPIILTGAFFRTSLPFCRYMCVRTTYYRTV
jgi:hypothetical protein